MASKTAAVRKIRIRVESNTASLLNSISISMLQPCFQACERFHSRKLFLAIGSSYVKQHGLHPRLASANVVDRIYIADVKTFRRIGFHFAQGRLEDCRVRFFVSNNSGVGDTG